MCGSPGFSEIGFPGLCVVQLQIGVPDRYKIISAFKMSVNRIGRQIQALIICMYNKKAENLQNEVIKSAGACLA